MRGELAVVSKMKIERVIAGSLWTRRSPSSLPCTDGRAQWSRHRHERIEAEDALQRLDLRIARVADLITIGVQLIQIRNVRTVVAVVVDLVGVLVVANGVTAALARIAELVAVGIGLVGVGRARAVVVGVRNAIAVHIARAIQRENQVASGEREQQCRSRNRVHCVV